MKTEFTVDKEFILQAHKEACSEWKTKLEDKFPDAFKNQFEIGRWYKSSFNLFYASHLDSDKIKGYGFHYGEYSDDRKTKMYWGCIDSISIVEAKDKEVEKALIKEAERRGLVEGVQFRCLSENKIHTINDFHYSIDGSLYSEKRYNGGGRLFLSGEWAKPIENETQKKIKELKKQLDELKQIL